MTSNKIINVKTRKEFIEHVRNIFIPECNRLFGKEDKFFNFGYAMNNWIGFAVTCADGSTIDVNLEDDKN